jgi:rhodanese-related sulfurtransferase
MNRNRWKHLLTSLAVYASLALLYLRPVRAEDMNSIRSLVRKKFPAVRQLSTGELSRWLSATNRPAPLLVDVRSAEEFAVSHLEGARHLESAEAIKAALKSTGDPVVLYCSVGYRSSAIAEKLHKAGCTGVWNLEGSIFAWANEGRAVFRGTNRVSEVHPFSAKWGRLLDNRFHPASR